MKTLRIIFALMMVLMLCAVVLPVNAEAPADIIDTYTIEISPQSDGTLVMNYTLENYCAKSDWPGEYPYLQIGVPNGSFTITDWGPKDGMITKAESVSDGGTFVQLDFDKNKLPKNGDCFDLNFSTVQGKMAYPDEKNNQITFKFIPAGWSFPVKVNKLVVRWTLPEDKSQLNVTEPSPTIDGNTFVWQWNLPVMNSSNMFGDYAVKLAYKTTAFTLTDDSTTKSESGNGGSSLSLLAIIIIVIVIIVVIVLLAIWLGDGGGYGGGGYSGGGGIFGGSSGGHSGGGGLGGGGSGSSCACAGCACACACAGGGRVGCSRKGIGIKCLPEVVEEERKANEEKGS